MKIAILAAVAAVTVAGPALATDYKFNLDTAGTNYTFYADTANEDFEFLGFDYGVSSPFYVNNQQAAGHDVTTFLGFSLGIADVGNFSGSDKPFTTQDFSGFPPTEGFVDGNYTGVFFPSGSDVSNAATLEISSGTPTDPGTISAAPEPGTWALMMLGVAGLGAALRFRRRETGQVATA